MPTIHRALAGAIAVLTPLAVHAQSAPPASAPMQDATPPASAAAAPVAAATAAATPTAGATVYGSDGAPVGTITSVADGNAVVDTGSRKATLALNSFGSGPQGPTITVTKAQLEDAVAKATPPAPAAAPEKPAKGKGSKTRSSK